MVNLTQGANYTTLPDSPKLHRMNELATVDTHCFVHSLQGLTHEVDALLFDYADYCDRHKLTKQSPTALKQAMYADGYKPKWERVVLPYRMGSMFGGGIDTEPVWRWVWRKPHTKLQNSNEPTNYEQYIAEYKKLWTSI